MSNAIPFPNPSDPIPLSLLNDFLYCQRRAALKAIEGWRGTNEHTVVGDSVHEQADVSGYETVKGVWDERFERRHGFWRGYWDTAIASYLDCGLFESGFARVVCPRCRAEFLVAWCLRRLLLLMWTHPLARKGTYARFSAQGR